MKVLSPTLRDSYRYVAFTTFLEEPVKLHALQKEIVAVAFGLFGAVGASKFSMKIIAFNGVSGIVRCHYKHVDDVRAVLASLSRVGNSRICAVVMGISGTIKTATEKYLQIEMKLRRNVSSCVTVPVSGKVVRIRGNEIDIISEDKEITDRADVQFIGITVYDNERLI